MVAQKPKSSDRSSHLHEMRAANFRMQCSVSSRPCDEDLRHPIHNIAAELVDPSPCTRRIALGKLQCALTNSVLTTCDPENDVKPLLRSLLEWFNLPAPSHEILILSMLSRLAQDTENRKLLIDLGADEFMRQYQADCCQTIRPYVLSLLQNLLEPNANAGKENVRSIYLHDTGLGFVVPTTLHPIQANKAGSVCERSAENVKIKEQESKMACDSYVRGFQPLGKPCPVVLDILDNDDPCQERERGAYTDGYRASPPCGEICWHPSSVTHAVSPASRSLSEQAGKHNSQACPSHEGQEKAGLPRLSPPPKQPETHMFADSSDTGDLEPILPCVRLEENDDKYLFNLNVTLQYLDDREVLQAALKELREAVVFDFHPEAILQKYSIVQNSFLLLQKITDGNLEQMVFDFLLELVRQIKAALKISKETSFQVHLDSEPPLQGARGAGGADHEKLKDLECSYPTYLRQTTGNTFDNGNFQRTISLRRTLHQMALELISLLTTERHRNMSFTILYDLLPLLKPPKSNLLDDKVQVHFAQYFHALCEVLQACNALSEDLDILCKDVTSKRNFEKRAQRCSHLLRVLTFSAELLYLLQPLHVTGLLPSALVKPLITLAGDLILSECAFGLQRNIFPYLKYLDPEFFKSYTCATEASFTLHVLVKELASSEEAAAQWKNNRPDALSLINAELLLKCMIQAVPNYAYFNHNYLVPRIMNIVPDILRMELVKACQSKDVCHPDDNRCDLRNESSKCRSVESVINQARRLIWLLLSHASASVRQAAYDSLLEVSSMERRQSQLQDQSRPTVHDELKEKCKFGNVNVYFDSDDPCCLLHDSSGPLRPLSVLHRLLIFGTSIMGEIITVGLHDTATCKQSALLLQNVTEQLSEMEVSRIIPGYPWMACSAYLSPDLASIIEHLRSLLFRTKSFLQREFQPGNGSTLRPEWAQLSCILRSLFSSSTSDRCRASTELLGVFKECCLSEDSFCWWLGELNRPQISTTRALQNPPDFGSDDQLQFLRDPFHQCLKFKEATLFSLAFGSPTLDSTKKEKFGFPPNVVKKVEDFLSIFKSTSAAEPIRKAAVEHLTWFIQDQSLRALLTNDGDLFKILIGEILDWIKKGDMRLEDSGDMQCSRSHTWNCKRMDRNDKGSTELGISCLNLLARLAPASALEGVPPDLPEMLISNSCELLWLLVPLIFYPLECVRNDMALLLAFTLFSSDRLLRDVNEIILDHDPEYCRLPSKGDTLSATLNSAEKDWIQIAVPGPFIGAYVFPCKVVVVPVRPSVQSTGENLLDEQLVHRIIAQSVLLQGGHENLLNSLESRVVSAGEPLRNIELQTLACLSVLHADISIKNLLKLLADPRLVRLDNLHGHV